MLTAERCEDVGGDIMYVISGPHEQERNRILERTLDVPMWLVEVARSTSQVRAQHGAMKQMHDTCVQNNEQTMFAFFTTSERHQRSHCFHLASCGHRDI